MQRGPLKKGANEIALAPFHSSLEHRLVTRWIARMRHRNAIINRMQTSPFAWFPVWWSLKWNWWTERMYNCVTEIQLIFVLFQRASNSSSGSPRCGAYGGAFDVELCARKVSNQLGVPLLPFNDKGGRKHRNSYFDLFAFMVEVYFNLRKKAKFNRKFAQKNFDILTN